MNFSTIEDFDLFCLDNNLISLYSEYEISDFSHTDKDIIASSKPIDVACIMMRHNKIGRKVSLQKVLQSYILSSMIRCGFEVLQTKHNFLLVKYKEIDFPFFPLPSQYYLTDNDAFLWMIEYASKWVFRVHCKIQVRYY